MMTATADGEPLMMTTATRGQCSSRRSSESSTASDQQRPRGRADCSCDDRRSATLAAIYSSVASLTTMAVYCYVMAAASWQQQYWSEVYGGIQASYAAILVAEATTLALSTVLLVAITQENSSLIVPWVIGFIGSLSLEALAVIYSNILREHLNQIFDRQCHLEVGALLAKGAFHVLAISAVVRFYRQLRNGATWKPCEIIEL